MGSTIGAEAAVDINTLKTLLATGSPAFLPSIRTATDRESSFAAILALHTLRRRAVRAGQWPKAARCIRLAVVGGCSLRPLVDIIEHIAATLLDLELTLWLGDYDNYVSEIMEADSGLYEFKPNLTFVIPSETRCVSAGSLTAEVDDLRAEADNIVAETLALVDRLHQRSGGEVILANFRLPPHFDPGPLRASLASTYGLRKYVNLQLAWKAPASLQICDVEFLANRLGTLHGTDERTWFESKQPYSSDLLVLVAKELITLIGRLYSPPKKVAVLDLDNTLWGGVIGDDGLDGIELGATSARGEAYRDFQKALLDLSKRGVLLAVCSKNDHKVAAEAFEQHPEMLIRMKDIACFKANWEPKSENIKEIAAELNLGLDSLVFLDDNPAEIEIVRQFIPQVTAICLGDDPSTYSTMLKDSRVFEQRAVTREDVERQQYYKRESDRRDLETRSTDMASYLGSLKMAADIIPFNTVDASRISQLINKSNQFNLTTVRRSLAEVQALVVSPNHRTFTVRLTDRFGDHGLIAVVIAEVADQDLVIDTWLMSCRVLKRRVEELTLNQLVQLAQAAGCRRLVGVYRPTAKNGMVAELYRQLGFSELARSAEETTYQLNVAETSQRDVPIVLRGLDHAAE